jgi:hypothetical protein
VAGRQSFPFLKCTLRVRFARVGDREHMTTKTGEILMSVALMLWFPVALALTDAASSESGEVGTPSRSATPSATDQVQQFFHQQPSAPGATVRHVGRW